MRKVFRTITIIISGLFLAELFCRTFLHLHTPPLYIRDDNYEYIYAPGQNIRNMGNHIITNEFSMRSKPLTGNDTIRILKIGDSVINGGSLTDHDRLASTLLEDRLSAEFNQPLRVLNVSAGSWGPDNAMAYIKKYGHFNALIIFFVFSSHDLLDNMTFQPVVGIHPSYPSESPSFALISLATRYLPHFLNLSGFNIKYGNNGSTYSNNVNSGWADLVNYAKQHNLVFTGVIHPKLSELNHKEYDATGKQLMVLLDELGVEYIRGIDFMKPDCYRKLLWIQDDIHLNDKGQQALADSIFPLLLKKIKQLVYHEQPS